MQLIYWRCLCVDDSNAYSIRERTKKAALERREADGVDRYDEPEKVTIEYEGAFDLLKKVIGESSGDY